MRKVGIPYGLVGPVRVEPNLSARCDSGALTRVALLWSQRLGASACRATGGIRLALCGWGPATVSMSMRETNQQQTTQPEGRAPEVRRSTDPQLKGGCPLKARNRRGPVKIFFVYSRTAPIRTGHGAPSGRAKSGSKRTQRRHSTVALSLPTDSRQGPKCTPFS